MRLDDENFSHNGNYIIILFMRLQPERRYTIYPSTISTSSPSSLLSSCSLTVACRTYTIPYIKGRKQTVDVDIMKNHTERGNLFELFFNIRIGLDDFNTVTKHGQDEMFVI